MESQIIINEHAYERAKKRMGLSKKAAKRLAEKAYSFGIKHKDTHGQLQRYFDKIFLSHKTSTETRVYGEFVYIFNENTLITILNLDNKLKKIINDFS